MTRGSYPVTDTDIHPGYLVQSASGMDEGVIMEQGDPHQVFDHPQNPPRPMTNFIR